MKEYNFTEVDLFRQTLYFTWLKENRKVIDIDDIASFNEIIKKIAEENNIKISYYKREDEDQSVENYFKTEERKYILLPWYELNDIDKEMPSIIIDNKSKILNKMPIKEEKQRLEYEKLYDSLKLQLSDNDLDYVKKR